ncbi:hypothetical protein FRC07_011150 [Ceratobasidium sp. 392]|nr:hypothetical protein FRC07_011150 [Ceratobasidium sp. 392]
MGKAKRQTRATRKHTSPSPHPFVANPDNPPRGTNTSTKQSKKPRVSFTFETLRDLIVLLSDKQPWAAEHGTTTQVWTDIANKLNDDHSLNPRVGYRTVQKKAGALRQLQEDGKSPELLRLPLTSEQHIQVASILDTMVTRWGAWDRKKDEEQGIKSKSLHRREVLGAHYRRNALLDMSARDPTPPLESCPSSPRISPPRAMSAPPTGAHSVPSVTALVGEVTAAVDRAEGMRAQREEALQRELIRATRDNSAATLRLAIALEQIGSTFVDFSTQYFKAA